MINDQWGHLVFPIIEQYFHSKLVLPRKINELIGKEEKRTWKRMGIERSRHSTPLRHRCFINQSVKNWLRSTAAVRSAHKRKGKRTKIPTLQPVNVYTPRFYVDVKYVTCIYSLADEHQTIFVTSKLFGLVSYWVSHECICTLSRSVSPPFYVEQKKGPKNYRYSLYLWPIHKIH